MSVQMVGDFGFSFDSGSVYTIEGDFAARGEDAAPVKGAPPKQETSSTEWSLWGTDNKLPLQMADHIEHCGILNAAINVKSSLATGKGVQPFLLKGIDSDGKEDLVWLTDNEILDWIEDNSLYDTNLDFAFDLNAYGWRLGSYMLNGKKDYINRIIRKDVTEARLAKMKQDGFIPEVFLCSDWASSGSSYDSKKMVKLPALKEGMEYDDLVSRKGTVSEVAFIDRIRRNGRRYYPYPMWWSALEWVKGARTIPVQKNAIYRNQLLLKQLVTIHEQYWIDNVDKSWQSLDATKRKELKKEELDKIDKWLSGSDHAGKSLFTGSYIPRGSTDPKPIPYIEITPIDDKFGEGKLLPDSSAANVEILMAMMTNPAFIGAGGVGGKAYGSQSGGSNIRESYLTAIMMMEGERKRIIKSLNTVARFNGWTKKYNKDASGEKAGQRLVFRYQGSLLTTLDTGKSTSNENL